MNWYVQKIWGLGSKVLYTIVRVPNLQLLETNLTFLVVLRFEICLHLDNFSSSFLVKNKKYNLGFENVNFENNDILFYLFFALNNVKRFWILDMLNNRSKTS